MDVSGSLNNALQISGKLIDSYEKMDIPVQTYVLTILLPAFLFFLGTVIAAVFWNTLLAVRLLLPVLGALMLLGGVAYPKIAIDRRRIEMENRFHLMVTHMTILSTTNIDRMEVFRKLAKEEEYGELTTENRRVVQLVDIWNQSLDDALQRRAKEIPSDSVTDLFERLAYTLGAGQELQDFLYEEHDVIIENYKTVYEQSLENLDVLKDLYLSMVLSMTFALVFAVVLPILTSTNPTWTVSAVIVIYVFIQIGFYSVIKTVVPYDPLWYIEGGLQTKPQRRVLAATGISIIGFLILTVSLLGAAFNIPPFTLIPIESIPSQLYMAIPIIPLLIPAFEFRRQENAIIDRDDEFPSFIRALGTSESAKQATTSTVLKTLKNKDFGSLTPEIENLYARLNMRLKTTNSWRYFARDTQSYLIQKFSEMYLIGREMGGEPKKLGELIGKNMNEVNQLREQRRQVSVTLVGLMYGITAASTFAFFTGLEIATIMSGFELEVGNGQFNFGQLIHTESYNIPLLKFMLYMIIVFNALVSSITIRTADGGHYGNAFLHFVALVWIGSMTALGTEMIIEGLLDVDI